MNPESNDPAPPALPKENRAPEAAPKIPDNPTWGVLFEALLKNPGSLIHAFLQEKARPGLSLKLLILAAISILVFGLTIGSFAMHEQLWAAPVKTLLGLFVAALICLPSLYIFTALTGTTLKFPQIAQGLAAALALLGAILLGFAPVLWVFSQSTNSIGFMGFLVVSAWLIALFFGTGFLLKMLKASGNYPTSPLRVWIGIFLLVTLQMSTSLRPLLGRSEHFMTSEKRFFLENWFSSVDQHLDDEAPETTQNDSRRPLNSEKSTPQKPETKSQRGSSAENPNL